ncbi:MAG: arylsulfatase [Planctomycetes bacterium]|nr:arylsulfatase [Planctomycetota bacterium]
MWKHNFGILVDVWDRVFGTYQVVEWKPEKRPFQHPLRNFFRIKWFCLPLALVLHGQAFADERQAAAARPNIVFILADDLGYGDLRCYGQEQIKTPNIDRMAVEGVRFTQFYAGATVCAPSRCVLMTGRHTGHCYIRGNAKLNLRPEHVTVAEILKDAGYTCGLYGKWGLGHEGSSGVPTRQGLDEFFGYLDQHHAHNYYPAFLMRGEVRVPLKNVVPGEGDFGRGVATEKVEYSHDLIAEEALAFLDRHHQQPFFLYLAFTVPHANNEAGKQGMEVPDYGLYAETDWPDAQKGTAAMISRLDRDVGRVLEALKRHGIDEQTVVMFSSDNGPHREGGNNPDFFDSNGPLRGIKRDLYEGGIRVPMIVRWPGHVPPGRTSDHIGYFGDFLATAAELAGAQPDVEHDGISFLAACRGRGQQPRHDYLYWEFYEQGGRRAARMDDWKGVLQSFDTTQPIELYDLSTDVGETQNVADKHPEVVAQIRTVLKKAHVPSPLWNVRPKRRAAGGR